MIFHIIGITGTFEGYIAGPADLYNKGNNAKGVRRASSADAYVKVEFLNGYIHCWGTAGGVSTILESTSPINATGYSKINVHFISPTNWAKVSNKTLSVRKSSDNSVISTEDLSSQTVSAETTISMAFTYAGNVTFKLSGALGNGVAQLYIDRIYLS